MKIMYEKFCGGSCDRTSMFPLCANIPAAQLQAQIWL